MYHAICQSGRVHASEKASDATAPLLELARPLLDPQMRASFAGLPCELPYDRAKVYGHGH
jgi:hypothetical protein